MIIFSVGIIYIPVKILFLYLTRNVKKYAENMQNLVQNGEND